MDKPVRNKKNLNKGLKRSAGKPACCVSKGGDSSNTVSLPNQVAKTKGFEKRAQYYAAKAYSRQAEKGDQYHNLKEIIFIAIADCILFPNKDGYKSDHIILDRNSYEHNLKDFYFTFIELPKFPKTKEDQLENIVEKWVYFFKYANETSEEDLERIIGSDLIIKRAYEELNRFNWSEKEYIAYEQEIKRIKDEYAVLLHKLDLAAEKGRQEGRREGRQEGIKIGKERGKVEGIAEGEKQAKVEVAKNLLEDNVPIDVISRTTGLPIDKIKELASQE